MKMVSFIGKFSEPGSQRVLTGVFDGRGAYCSMRYQLQPVHQLTGSEGGAQEKRLSQTVLPRLYSEGLKLQSYGRSVLITCKGKRPFLL